MKTCFLAIWFTYNILCGEESLRCNVIKHHMNVLLTDNVKKKKSWFWLVLSLPFFYMQQLLFLKLIKSRYISNMQCCTMMPFSCSKVIEVFGLLVVLLGESQGELTFLQQFADCKKNAHFFISATVCHNLCLKPVEKPILNDCHHFFVCKTGS